MHSQDQLEIRLLGPVLVRRRDGEAVDPKAWRTAKSLELVRLLALNNGEPVAIDIILDRLWPHAPAKKAQASLRTAAYHARLVLGDDAIERRADGLVLHHAWTDAHAYRTLADEIEAARRAGQHLRVAALSREAEALYIRDIDVEGSGEWLIAAQQRWQALRLTVLLAASESAAGLGRMQEALDLAFSAVELEPSSERAVRVLMRAFGALGEIEKGLSAFERLRRELAEQYGVDPAPQTRALHVQLLASTANDGDTTRADAERVVGHDDALQRLTSVLRGSSGQAPRPGVVWVVGAPGSGRATVIRAACKRARLAGALVTPEIDTLTTEQALRLESWAVATGSVLIVPTTSRTVASLPAGSATSVVHVHALVKADVVELLQLMLQGDPSPPFVDEVMDRTGGRSGELCETVREWLHLGRIMWTPEGMSLDVGPDAVPVFPETTGRVLRSLGTLEIRAVEALAVVAVVGGRVTAADVDAVLKHMRPQHPMDARVLLNRLADAGLLRVAPAGYHLRNGRHRSELFAWLRPNALRRLHSAVAHELALEPSDRILHLMASGQHQLACDLGVQALTEACEEGAFDTARGLIDVLSRLPARMQPSSSSHLLGHHLARCSRSIGLRASA